MNGQGKNFMKITLKVSLFRKTKKQKKQKKPSFFNAFNF